MAKLLKILPAETAAITVIKFSADTIKSFWTTDVTRY